MVYNAFWDWIGHNVYHLDPPERKRMKPMKVLALGLSRSGTESLRIGLQQLGYDHVYHGWDSLINSRDLVQFHALRRKKYDGGPTGDTDITAEDLDKLFGHCEAVTDAPTIFFASDLIRCYPEAKVILNWRPDEDAWHKSMVATFVPMQKSKMMWLMSWFVAETFWVRYASLGGLFPLWFQGGIDANAKWRAREYYAMLRGLVPEERLLEWTVQDGWGPLCDFLGKEVPKQPFPSGNSPKEFEETWAKCEAEVKKKAFRNVGITAVLMAGAVAVGLQKLGPANFFHL